MDGIHDLGGMGGFGAVEAERDEPVFHAPCFVVTHRPAETIVKDGGTSYVFVTGGPAEALRLARDAAGQQVTIQLPGAAPADQPGAARPGHRRRLRPGPR